MNEEMKLEIGSTAPKFTTEALVDDDVKKIKNMFNEGGFMTI